MANLSKRIEKAGKLQFVEIPGCKTLTAGTTGSNGERYQLSLSRQQGKTAITVADKIMMVNVIFTNCEYIDLGNGKRSSMEPCKGNCRHTVCYHTLGFLKQKMSQDNKQISFYQDIFTALNGLNFGGELVKVQSKQGKGFIWAIVRSTKSKILSSAENIRLMRGAEDDEGID